ncbi:MAG TPA: P-loop NTPase fold protein [Thermodesulfobacteriota bacterium]|nr:P-loop NTPase fold protein [Thermodesulfobacteriota bacterium]
MEDFQPLQTTTDCRTRILSDLPAEADAFGSHQRVAQAIATLIREEDGGKAIALTGSWGSGKSTVVKFLKSLLSESAKANTHTINVFVFDAWAHQGDPLRRSFLETFIQFHGNIAEKWKNDIERITRRREETDTTSEPILTFPGKLIALCALFLPLGYMLFSTLFDQNYLDPNFFNIRVPLWLVGLLLSLLPLIVGFFTWIAWKPTWRFWKKEFWTQYRSPHEGDSIVSLFIHKTREINKSTTIRTPDPTSLEFRDIFTRILNDTIGKSNQKLVIIIDNLDRVDPQEALAIWSTMRTFFEWDSQMAHSWMRQFWLLVPFDPTSLNRLWGSEGHGSGHLITAFVDKTFQTTFHVPPPVLSDWKEFLINQLEIALPDHQPKDFHIIYRLYRLKGIAATRPPTPRDIKLFINKIGAYHRIWGDKVSLQFQALYVLCANELQASEEAFVKADFVDRRIQRLVGDDFLRWLAVLHYSVEPPDKALQVLIGKQIEDALSKGDYKNLKKLENIPGFLEVCEHIVEENQEAWAKTEPDTIATAGRAFDGLETQGLQMIWRGLQNAVCGVEYWKKLDEEVGSGIIAILKNCQAENYKDLASHILGTLTRTSLPHTEKEGEKIFDSTRVKQWVKGTLQVIKTVHEAGYKELIKKIFGVPGDASFYIEIMIRLREEVSAEELAEYFTPKAEPEHIVDELARICNSGKLVEAHAESIDFMTKIGSEWPWKKLVNDLNQRLQGSNNLQTQEIAGCVKAMIYLVHREVIPQAKANLQQLCTHGHLMHHLHKAQAGKDAKAIALCIFPIFDFTPTGNLQSQIGNSAAGLDAYNVILTDPNSSKEVIEHLVSLILKFHKVEDLPTKVSTAPNTEPLVKAILEMIAQRDDTHKHISPSILINHYHYFKKTLSEDILKNLIKKLILKANLLSILTEHTFSEDLAGLYILAYEMGIDQEHTDYTNFLLDGIRTVQKDTWLQELKHEGQLLEIALRLAENGESTELTTNFLDALLDHARKIMDGQAQPVKFREKWSLVLSVLVDPSKQTFLRNLRDELINEPNKEIEPILALYGNELMESGLLDEEADKIVRHLFTQILTKRNLKELKWVQRAVNQRPRILEKCMSASKIDFQDRVRSALTEVEMSSEVRLEVEKIAQECGIDLAKTAAESDNSKDN